MTKTEALKLALEVLETIYYGTNTNPRVQYASITAIQEALAQPEQEPTRHCRSCGGTGERHTGVDESPTTICKPCDGTGQIAMAAQLAQPEPVMDYDKEELRGTFWDTTPPKRKEWVGLTDEGIYTVLNNLQTMYNRPPTEDSRVIFARAIEAKLKEKNHD